MKEFAELIQSLNLGLGPTLSIVLICLFGFGMWKFFRHMMDVADKKDAAQKEHVQNIVAEHAKTNKELIDQNERTTVAAINTISQNGDKLANALLRLQQDIRK